MNNQVKITFVELVLSLRQRVLEAKDKKDKEALGAFQVTLDTLSDIVAEAGDVMLASLLDDMACTTRDLWMNVDWKSTMPSIEDIQKTVGR